jgi:hypothetical protein
MKYAAIFSLAVLALGIAAAIPEPANAVVYCQYIDYPPSCVARPGVRLVARPGTVGAGAVAVGAGAAVGAAAVGAGARGVGVRPGTPTNRGGPVNRAGRR